MNESITISCFTCRKHKLIRNLINVYKCKHRKNSFQFGDNKPCDNWLPSKYDIKLNKLAA
ncbi:MAG: hypothetical protein ACFFDN_09200 [Candidatus Hodarchaeota archaeon]